MNSFLLEEATTVSKTEYPYSNMSILKPNKIAVFAPLANFEPSYSVAAVVLDQLLILSKKLEEVVFITTDDFIHHELLPENVIVRTIPRGKIENGDKWEELNEGWTAKYVQDSLHHYEQAFVDVKYCFAHDIIFIKQFARFNLAVREVKKYITTKFYFWMHSGPSKRNDDPCEAHFYTLPEGDEIVYLNKTDLERVAQMYNCPINKIRVVPNMVNITRFFGLNKWSEEIYNRLKLWEKDFICVYPTRLNQSKQIEKASELIESINSLGYNACLIVCNSFSNADKEKEYLFEISAKYPNTFFTSTLDKATELGLPQQSVEQLYRIADLFILPSISEACSMIMLEAGISKCLVVLNDDLQSLHEFGGQKIDDFSSLNTLYFDFGSVTRPIETYSPDRKTWFTEHAKQLINYSFTDKAISNFRRIRKNYSPECIWFNYLEPLLD